MLKFVGSDAEHGGHSPYQLIFNLTTEPEVTLDGRAYTPANEPTLKCSEAPPGEQSCSCKMCKDSCAKPGGDDSGAAAAPPPEEAEEPVTVRPSHGPRTRRPLQPHQKGKHAREHLIC